VGGIVSTFAAAVARGKNGWTASEIELTGLADIDEVADRLIDAEPEAEVSLLFVEADDLYLVIVRLDEGEDLRVFGSDSAFAEESRIGGVLLGDIEAPALELDDLAAQDEEITDLSEDEGADDEEGDEGPGVDEPATDADPVGDPEILADLGISSSRLLKLCALEGMMPADVTAEIAQRLGCADEVEELREA
jgi:putative tRNA adenosine deaminase-associated protein